MEGKPVVVSDDNSALVPKDYPSQKMTKWVKDILMIQQGGPKDYNKKAFTSVTATIFNPVQAKMVLDHLA